MYMGKKYTQPKQVNDTKHVSAGKEVWHQYPDNIVFVDTVYFLVCCNCLSQ